jgi:hypothetical protein
METTSVKIKGRSVPRRVGRPAAPYRPLLAVCLNQGVCPRTRDHECCSTSPCRSPEGGSEHISHRWIHDRPRMNPVNNDVTCLVTTFYSPLRASYCSHGTATCNNLGYCAAMISIIAIKSQRCQKSLSPGNPC